MPRNIVWLAGRGVSMSVGLDWDVPPQLYEAFKRGELDRDALCKRICEELARVQDDARLDTWPLDELLRTLRTNTRDWKHSFVTTNWDTVLDDVLRSHPQHEAIDPVVWHLNGSIEDPSTLCTEVDSGEARERAFEANKGFQQLLKANVCVVVGLSLKSQPDKDLAAQLGKNQGSTPAGETWLVVNHEADEVRHAIELLSQRLPQARLRAITTPFDAWVRNGMAELRELGVLQKAGERPSGGPRPGGGPSGPHPGSGQRPEGGGRPGGDGGSRNRRGRGKRQRTRSR
jgi:hypothetical protein